MNGSRMIAAAVGGLAIICAPAGAFAQPASGGVAQVSAAPTGSVAGVVRDERGAPVAGAIVSAFGPSRAVAVTDKTGRFELRTLAPGAYLVRAHVAGFVSASGQLVDVRASLRSTSIIGIRHASAAQDAASATSRVLAAGVGVPAVAEPAKPADADAAPAAPVPPDVDVTDGDDHSDVAWRLRHLRRSVLRDVVVPIEMLADADPAGDRPGTFGSARSLADGPSFANAPVSGQFNLLTTGSFDSSQQLFAGDSLSRGVAYVALTAPVGPGADWSVRGAFNQGDLSSWFIAGAYAQRGPSRNRYDVGLSYSTQRPDARATDGVRTLADASRNVGAIYGFDTFALTPAAEITVGARFSWYDYLSNREGGLLDPRIEFAVTPDEHLRIKALAASRSLAPGAEEFLAPTDLGMWLPPQRTFSSLIEGRGLNPERTDHFAVEAERDFGPATGVSLRAFHQRVSGQLVTMFGLDVPGGPSAESGHYFVANVGDFDATGWSAGFHTMLINPRIRGAVEYSLTDARWDHNRTGSAYMLVVAPATTTRPNVDRLQGLSTSIEANVPETATRVIVLCRLTSARAPLGLDRQVYDSRFDVQVHQSLPFMDFSTARWEMLLAVRNTFREMAPESSVYDELLVSRAPKRIVGGLTLKF